MSSLFVRVLQFLSTVLEYAPAGYDVRTYMSLHDDPPTDSISGAPSTVPSNGSQVSATPSDASQAALAPTRARAVVVVHAGIGCSKGL